jgi:hypothetical protein
MTEVSTEFRTNTADELRTKTSDELADEKKRIDRELKLMKKLEKEATDQ